MLSLKKKNSNTLYKKEDFLMAISNLIFKCLKKKNISELKKSPLTSPIAWCLRQYASSYFITDHTGQVNRILKNSR